MQGGREGNWRSLGKQIKILVHKEDGLMTDNHALLFYASIFVALMRVCACVSVCKFQFLCLL